MKFIFNIERAVILDDEDAIISSADPQALADTFFCRNTLDLGTLPPAVRWISNDGHGIVIERPPSYVIIYDEHNDINYQIPLPWSVYGFRLDTSLKIEKAYFFVRPFPISHMNDELYSYPIPGIESQDRINLRDPDSSVKLGKQILSMINDHWNNPKLHMHVSFDIVPEEWAAHWDEENIGKYLTHLQGLSLSDVLFTDYKTGSIPTVSSLTEALNGDVLEPKTVIEFFAELIKNSQ